MSVVAIDRTSPASGGTPPVANQTTYMAGSDLDAGTETGEDTPPLQPTSSKPSSVSSPTNAAAVAATAAVGGATGGVATKPKKKKKKTKKILNVCLTKYAVIREVADKMGFTLDKEDDEAVDRCEFNLLWTDTVMPMQRLARLQNWQRTNHFPSMSLLCRKVHLGLTLGRMRKLFPAYYNFAPRTFSLRSERQQFSTYLSTAGRRKTFILKPNAGCQGKGIVLTKDPLNAVEDLDQYVVQEYIAKPLLIENKKFDLRVYVLVTSVRNLSIHIFNDGLVRMCAEEYQKPTEENLSTACMHLTNYAVNKHHENFEFNTDADQTDTGSKRDFRFLNAWLEENGHSVQKFWEKIEHMINKALIAAQPQLTHVYNSVFPHNNDGWTCFEVLGFDVMVDEKMKPWLLEVNHTPSLACDTPLDHRIKSTLVEETWKIINVQATDKTRHQEFERMQFAKRMSARLVGAGGGGGGGAPNEEQLSSQSGTQGGSDSLRGDTIGLSVEEHLKDQDTRILNYKRIYPSADPERQILYEQMLQAAKDASSVQTTACQEQRQVEAKLEREKREAQRKKEKGMMMGNEQKDTVPASPVAQSGYGDERQPTPPSAKSKLSNGSTSSGSTGSGRLGRRTSATSNSTSGGLTNSGSVAPSEKSVRSGGANPPRGLSKEEREKQKQRLAEQMDRHRRRMILGPRLSVFQLRDAQVAAMVADETNFMSYQNYQQQQQQQASPTSQSLPSPHANGSNGTVYNFVQPGGNPNNAHYPTSALRSGPHNTSTAASNPPPQTQPRPSNPVFSNPHAGTSSTINNNAMAQLQRYRIVSDGLGYAQLPVYDLSHSIDTGAGFEDEEEEE